MAASRSSGARDVKSVAELVTISPNLNRDSNSRTAMETAIVTSSTLVSRRDEGGTDEAAMATPRG